MNGGWERDISATARASRVSWAVTIGGAVTFFIPFVMNVDFVLHHFYQAGPYLLDSGWIADLIWHNPHTLNPLSVLPAGHYFAIHAALLLKAANFVFSVLPLTRIQAFAVFEGAIYGSMGLATFALAMSALDARERGVTGAVALGLATPFSPIALSAISYPHFETAFVSGTLAVLASLLCRATLLPWVFLAVTVAGREDCGFHLFGILAVLLVYEALFLRRPLRDNKQILALAICAFFASVVMLVGKARYYPGQNAFVWTYAGRPPFAHVGWAMIATRLVSLWHSQLAAWLSFLVVLAWGMVRGNRIVLLGLLACVPWLLLNFFAVSDAAGNLYTYYGFPLIVATVWPLFGFGRLRQLGYRVSTSKVLLGQALVLAVGFFAATSGQGRMSIVRDMLYVNATAASQVERFVAIADSGGFVHGSLLIDQCVAALIPQAAFPSQVLGIIPGDPHEFPDNFLFFAGTTYQRHEVLAILQSGRLPYSYNVPGTKIMLARRDPLPADSPLRPIMAARGWPLMMMWAQAHGEGQDNGFYASTADGPELVFAGGDYKFSGTAWRLTLAMNMPDIPAGTSGDVARLQVVNQATGAVTTEKVIRVADLHAGGNQITLTFRGDGSPDTLSELRLWSSGLLDFRVVDLTLAKQGE